MIPCVIHTKMNSNRRQMPTQNNSRSNGRGRGRTSNDKDASSWFDNSDPNMPSRIRRAQNHHMEKQFQEGWHNDWEQRIPKPRMNARSQNFKKQINSRKNKIPEQNPKLKLRKIILLQLVHMKLHRMMSLCMISEV